MIQTRARSVHTQRCPHLLVLWPPRPRRASQEKRLQPPWCAVPPSYTAPLQPPRHRHSALQTRDLQRARRLQVPMASMSLHASSTRCLLSEPITSAHKLCLLKKGTESLAHPRWTCPLKPSSPESCDRNTLKKLGDCPAPLLCRNSSLGRCSRVCGLHLLGLCVYGRVPESTCESKDHTEMLGKSLGVSEALPHGERWPKL